MPLIRRVRREQPPFATGVNRRNPLTRGLVFCATPAGGDAFGRPLSGVTSAGPGYLRGGPGGFGLIQDSSFAAKYGTISNVLTGKECSLLVMANRNGTVGQYARLFDTKQGGNGLALFLNSGGAGQNAIRATCGANVTNHDVSGTLADTAKLFIVQVNIKDALAEIYDGGSLVASSTAGGGTLTQNPGNAVLLGSESASSIVSPFNGFVYLAALWNRYLSPAEVKALAANPWQVFNPRRYPIGTPVTAQFARPTADAVTGTWVSSLGGALYAAIDEATADDADYISTTYGSVCEVIYSELLNQGDLNGFKVRYRIAADAGGMTVRLRQGSTTIASWTHNPSPASLTTFAQTPSAGELASITFPATLKLQFEAF